MILLYKIQLDEIKTFWWIFVIEKLWQKQMKVWDNFFSISFYILGNVLNSLVSDKKTNGAKKEKKTN